MEQRRTKTIQRDSQRLISQFDGPSSSKFGENPRNVPWNNKNTEFEGRRQNMMGYSCMKAVVYEHTPVSSITEKNIIVTDIRVHHPQESQQSQLKKN